MIKKPNTFWNFWYLVGGSEHDFYDFPYIGKNHPNWRTHIFQVETTKQYSIVYLENSFSG